LQNEWRNIVISEGKTRKRKTYEKMERPDPKERCWDRNRLINLIPEVDDD
jgi:hypothetical protein